MAAIIHAFQYTLPFAMGLCIFSHQELKSIFLPFKLSLDSWITLEIESRESDKVTVLVYFLLSWNSAQLPYEQAQASHWRLKDHMESAQLP